LLLTTSPLNRLRFLALASVLSVGFALACGGGDDGSPPDAAATGGNKQNTGGAGTGGAATGGSTGGSSTGGAAAGGSSTGGAATGGSSTGGAGGKGTGGAGTGGSSTGGAGGKGTGGAGTGGMGGSCSLTYAGFAQPFFTKYCISCHSPGKKDLRTQTAVKAATADIKKEAVNATSMPPQNPKPTSAERAQLGAWLDCGAP